MTSNQNLNFIAAFVVPSSVYINYTIAVVREKIAAKRINRQIQMNEGKTREMHLLFILSFPASCVFVCARACALCLM